MITGSVLSIGLIAGATASVTSITPESIDKAGSGMCVKAYYADNESITATRCSYTDNVNSESPPDVEENNNYNAQNPEPVSNTIPEIINTGSFHALADTLWGEGQILDTKGNVTWENPESAIPDDLEERGDAYVYISKYDSQGRQIIVGSDVNESNSTTVRKVWRKSDNSYEYMGKLDAMPLYGSIVELISAPNGDLYYTVTKGGKSSEIYKFENGEAKHFRSVNAGGSNYGLRIFAINNSGSIAYSNHESLFINDKNGSTKSIDNALGATALENGDFIIGTNSGLSTVGPDGSEKDKIEIGRSVWSVELGVSGKITYNTESSSEKFEIRSFDPSTGKHLLWAYYQNIS